MNGRLARLHPEHGQSAWIDNLQRSQIRDGSLSALVSRGVRGLTSNPTIFQKAIKGSTAYDEQFAAAVGAGLDARDAYWDLVVTDIRDAADLFASVHRESASSDGFVSVEVDPALAHDAEATVAAARALRSRIARPNVMIKVPATVAGVSAVRTLVGEGCSVNVTLIFSVERHLEVMEAYIAGLEDAASRGVDPSGIAGVASFFISRVDSAIDPLLEAADSPGATSLVGRSAINQARLAYDAFTTMFSSPRWEALASLGARVQRPLWASTSTKNPAFADTLYVDELIGPDTVNTLPDATLEAFDHHGTVARTIDADTERARAEWTALSDHGIDTGNVARVLERDGIASFVASFEDVIGSLRDKAGH